jgi:hypothetical protein
MSQVVKLLVVIGYKVEDPNSILGEITGFFS